MGQALIACAQSCDGIKVVGQVDLGDDVANVLPQADVLIDFSFHDATLAFAELCAKHRKALVIGTTGHNSTGETAIKKLQSAIPIVWASNYSTGVNTLFWLTRKAAEALGPGFDLEVIETHHRAKKDAPSGTAMSLVQILADARKLKLAEALRHGRQGITGERQANEIGVHSLRGGDVVGDHTVVFATPGERLELTHKASSRDTFAQGALRAARWVADKKPGLYDMQDVLGLGERPAAS